MTSRVTVVMLRRAAQATAFFAVPVIVIGAYVSATSPRATAQDDPLSAATSDYQRSGDSWQGLHRSPDYRYLVGHFDRFAPLLESQILSGVEGRRTEVAYEACFEQGLAGIEFLIELSHGAPPRARTEIVRRLGIRLIYLGDDKCRDEVRRYLVQTERENTVAGYYAFLCLVTSGYEFEESHTKGARERAFRARGMDPYSDAALVPAEWRPGE